MANYQPMGNVMWLEYLWVGVLHRTHMLLLLLLLQPSPHLHLLLLHPLQSHLTLVFHIFLYHHQHHRHHHPCYPQC